MPALHIDFGAEGRPTQYEALYCLWQVYLHMRAWGQPEYDELPSQDRDAFGEIVRSGLLTEYVIRRQKDLIGSGLELPDEWLLLPPIIRDDGSLLRHDRDRLGAILNAMWPIMLRQQVQESVITPTSPLPPLGGGETRYPVSTAMSILATEGLSVPAKSTWSKAISKSPGQSGYLPHTRQGSHVLVTLTDARKFARSIQSRLDPKPIAVSILRKLEKK